MASVIKMAPLRSSSARFSAMRLTSRAISQSAQASGFSRSVYATNAWAQKSYTQSQARGFHASAKRSILPPLPQKIQGGVNDPAPVPDPNPTHGSYHWAFERLVAIGLIPLTVAPFAAGSLNPVTDAILCATLLIHSHIGFQACIIDYFPHWRVPKTRTLLNWVLRGATLAAGVGLYEFETNDVGLTEAIKKVWKA